MTSDNNHHATPVLVTKGLSKYYSRRIKAVDNLSLEVPPGSVFGILGPNGSGKTTTLGLILDVINRTSGEYFWFGEEPTKEHRKKIGAILETPVFYPYLSGVNNLEIVAEIKSTSYDRINPMLEKVGLAERKNDKYKTYSLGMKQRLAIASSLLCDPEVMILDEPTNGLDPQGIAEIRELIIQIGREGKTIILASHLLDEVQKVCSHFGVLKQGKMIYSGSVEEVSKGVNIVEVRADDDRAYNLLHNSDLVEKVDKDANMYTITTADGTGAKEINRYLYENGVTISHLVTQKKSLEKQFLEILAESDD